MSAGSLFAEYVQHGLALCPIAPGSKGPRTQGWQRADHAVRDADAARKLPGAGLLHAWSRTCAVDVDDLHGATEYLAARGIDLTELLAHDEAVQIQSRRPNRAKLLYLLPAGCELLPTRKIERDGVVLFELRCATADGQSVQDVLPPTIHPDTGKPYEWAGAGDWRNLPELPIPLLELWRSLLDEPTKAGKAPAPGEPIGSGQRNDAMFKIACKLRGADFPEATILAALQSENRERCKPPLTDEELRSIARSAGKYDVGTPQAADGVILVNGSDLTPEPVEWLWRHWLARGKFHLLAGAPGVAKTTIAMGMAATSTIGGRWPDGSRCEVGNVLVWSGEDDPADTLLPRLLAAGADRSRVFFVTGSRIDGEVTTFDPARDMVQLVAAIERIGGISLLIVDPVVSAVTGDSHKNTEVRRALQPLVDLAAATGAAVLGISHFSKGGQGADPLQRVIGSVAFGALPRIVMVAAKVKGEDGDTARVLARSKSNIGPDDGGFEYHLEQVEAMPGIEASRVLWGKSVDGTARELLTDPDAEESSEGSARDTAAEFLRQMLGADTVPVKTLEAEARAAGIAWRTIRRAADALHVVKRKGGQGAGWYWSIPKMAGKVSNLSSVQEWTPWTPSADTLTGEGCSDVR